MSDSSINLLNYTDLLNLPDPTWLIEGVLPEGDYSVIWGPSGQGKSFVALDWAVAIALGISWQGRHKTKQGPVIYIAAEGGRGMKKRARALAKKHGVTDIRGLYFLIEPLYVQEPGIVEAFLEELEKQGMWPSLIIIDTLSRSFGGGEENSSADMGHFIEAITYIAKERLVTLLIVHHSNATGEKDRGHSSLKGGASAMFKCTGVKTDKGVLEGVVLKNHKQKDEVDADEMYLRSSPFEGSLVLDWEPMPEKQKKSSSKSVHVMSKVDMLTTLGNSEEGYTWKEWILASKVPKHLFNTRIKQLLEHSEIVKANGKYFVAATTLDIAAVETPDEEEG